jgi:hypothetical protein
MLSIITIALVLIVEKSHFIHTAGIGFYIHPHKDQFTEYCDTQHNVKCIGDWIGETNSSDPVACEQACERMPGCIAYATNDQENKCILKKTPVSCFTSSGWKLRAKHRPIRGYVPKCFQDCANVVLQQVETNDADYCGQLCDNNPQCTGFVVCYVCKRCWLQYTLDHCGNYTHYSVRYAKIGGAPKPFLQQLP